MRLIDADALREVLETAVPVSPITQQYNKEDVIRAIMDAPTIAHGTESIMIKWTPDLDKLARDVAFRGLNEFSFLGKSIREWVEIILEQQGWVPAHGGVVQNQVDREAGANPPGRGGAGNAEHAEAAADRGGLDGWRGERMKMKKCVLFDWCLKQTTACYAMGPTDDGCPWYKHFRSVFQKPPEPPRFIENGRFACPDCGAVIGLGNPCCWSCGRAIMW